LLLVLCDHVLDFGVKFVVDVDILAQVDKAICFLILDEHVSFYLHEGLETYALNFCLKVIVLLLKLLDVMVFSSDLALGLGQLGLEVFEL
jgi:hypothetical protein